MARLRERIAVTGVGIVSALGTGAEASFLALVKGKRGMGPVTLFETTGLRCTIAAEVKEFSAEAMSAGSREEWSRTDALALVAGREALAGSGFVAGDSKLGFAIGGTTGSMLETERDLARRHRGPMTAERATRLLSFPLSTTVRVLEAAIGPFQCTATVCSACSSGAVALIQAAHWLLSGEANAVLAGGADALCRMTFAGFNAIGAVDKAPCRPFDVARAGLTLGEGAAFLLLETESRARARGARIHALLSGWSVGAEAHHMTHPEASGARAERLIAGALAAAGLAPSGIDYVNAHGTATLQNDAMEARAIRRAFGEHLSKVRVSSNKAQVGHALGAAGALEAAFTVLSLERGVVTPTVGLETPEATDIRHVMGESEYLPLRAAISSSFGFGGMDAVLVFENEDSEARPGTEPKRSIVVSGAAVLAGELLVDEACASVLDRSPSASPLEQNPIAELDPERSRRFDRGAAWITRAVEAALSASALAPEAVGLVVGSAYGPVERSVHFLDRIVGQGLRAVPPAEFPHLVQSAAAGNASIYLGLQGPVLTSIDGVVSAEAAFARARGLLELGVAEAVIAGAVEAHDPFVAELGPLVREGKTIARSESGAFLVLESRLEAQKRHKSPLARLDFSVEQRGAPELDARAFRAPAEPRRARVVLAALDGSLEALLMRSPWAEVARVDVREHAGHNEATGGIALAVGAALVRRGAKEVLVLSGGSSTRYFTRFSEPEGPA